MPSYVVERYRSRSDPDSLRAVAARLAAGTRHAGPRGTVRYVRTLLLPEDETCLDPTFRALARRAGLEVDRIVPAEHVEPRDVG